MQHFARKFIPPIISQILWPDVCSFVFGAKGWERSTDCARSNISNYNAKHNVYMKIWYSKIVMCVALCWWRVYGGTDANRDHVCCAMLYVWGDANACTVHIIIIVITYLESRNYSLYTHHSHCWRECLSFWNEFCGGAELAVPNADMTLSSSSYLLH